MAKLWAGVTDGQLNQLADKFNASIAVDSRLYREDITGSMAHVTMLGAQGIVSQADADLIVAALQGILQDIESGALVIDNTCEDIHTFVEQTLVARIGDAGKRLHTARSRNDQVALDTRLYVRNKVDDLTAALRAMASVLCDKAEQYKDAVMCGYTHLQRAQPITFGHHLMAYVSMFLRDIDRFVDCRRRLNVCPLGSCALAGTSYPINRFATAQSLGFDGAMTNSIDAVSDRDYCCEVLFDLSLVAVHISRLCEELVLWSSWEFGYIKLPDAFTTGSSIMPQKKNPDIAELCRGKTGRVVGDLVSMLTTLKGLPLAYNKDMQEDKEAVFDALDTVSACVEVCIPMLQQMQADRQAMLLSVKRGFVNATDVADYLAQKGLPFRTAYHIVGQLVAYCMANNTTLDDLPLDRYQAFCPQFEGDIYGQIDPQTCVKRRTSLGGTAVESVESQIQQARRQLQSV